MLEQEKLDLYRSVLEKAVGQRAQIEKTVAEITKKKISNIYLVGAGGSLAVMYPCKYVMELNSSLRVEAYNPSEFLAMKPKNLGENSLVILSSYTGNTPETVEAAEYVRSLGAVTIGFVGVADTPLGKAVDYVFANKADEGTTDSKLIMLYQIMFNLLRHLENYERYEEFVKAIEILPSALVRVREKVEPDAVQFAKAKKNSDYFMVLGSGPCWGEAYSYATCILEEMQWILAQPVHSGEFFHGAFEIVVDDTELILFKGEDATRSLAERVETFATKYTRNLTVLDTQNHDLPGVSEEFRGYFSPLVCSAAIDVYSKNLANERNHPLKTRRYMHKVEY